MEEEKGEPDWAPLAVDLGYYCPLKAGSIDGTDSVPHDRAIVRAQRANYKVSKPLKGDPETTLFVARLSHNTTEDMLRDAFSKYGKIENCRLVRDIVTGRSKGYAFIEFKHLSDAEEAYYDSHKVYLDGSQIVVDFECARVLPGWVPRRLGGGFGGKKESGQLRFGGRDRPFKKPIVLGSMPLGAKRRRSGEDERGYHSFERDSRRRERDFPDQRNYERSFRATRSPASRRRDSDHRRYSDRHRKTQNRTRSRSRSKSPVRS